MSYATQIAERVPRTLSLSPTLSRRERGRWRQA